jgi:hypothetical protein
MNNQQIRPSQFITTFGPGSILETRTGPVIVTSLDRVYVSNGLALQDFEVRDARLSRDPVLNGAGILRVPTNAEIGREEQFPVYPTEPFPYWSLCVQHRILYMARNGCPQCPRGSTQRMREKAGREAIRFVRACTAGHLDDVDWNYVVHGGATCVGQPGYYSWEGGGSSLRNVAIRCPNCSGPPVNFGWAYSRDWRCSGRLPEEGPRPAQSSCSVPARIIQRGAANLRVASVLSALTIPPLASRLHNLLQDGRIMATCSALTSIGLLNEQNFWQGLRSIQPPLSSSVLQFLQQKSWSELSTAISQVMQQATGRSSLKESEFESLRFAAQNGAPAVPSPQVGAPPLFEVRLSDVRNFQGPDDRYRFRVVPISRLRMVLVQLGYQRLDPPTAQTIPVSFQFGGRFWYPGVELFGEGIYLEMGEVDLNLGGSRRSAWDRSYNLNPTDDSLHPIHVWWHTLSHRLLRALSVDSGYSSASIRERVYVELRAGRPQGGGLLLYTVQPGGDGTLGGLISLVPSFGDVIRDALRDLPSCSNDPLCEEAQPDGINGAACYSCLLASETSCEHQNTRLDRMLLLQNMP